MYSIYTVRTQVLKYMFKQTHIVLICTKLNSENNVNCIAYNALTTYYLLIEYT